MQTDLRTGKLNIQNLAARIHRGCNISTRTTEFGSSKSVLDEKPPDIRTTAVALGGVVESMVSQWQWKMLQDLHVHIHIWPLCNATEARHPTAAMLLRRRAAAALRRHCARSSASDSL